MRLVIATGVYTTLCFTSLYAEESDSVLQPYTGPSNAGVDTSTLTGKVMCGYQGWFNCEGDGADLKWVHWIKNRQQAPGPGNVTVDLWPDLTEYGPDERFATSFKHTDGRNAEVFSSYNKATVLRHFKWMDDYGIDGAFVQRFANGLKNKKQAHHKNTVLSHAREGANRNGRTYAVMYDLSGMGSGKVDAVRQDWINLRTKMQITKDPAYLNHEGGPVVAIWGIGFSDDRAYSLSECRELIEFLKADKCTVMLGVPSWWREGKRDAVPDPELQKIIELADIVSPWTVGRYRKPAEVKKHAETVWAPDVAWCKKRQLDFLPVVYPGFSWHNLKGEGLASIPRLKGQFLWSQLIAAKRSGCEMIYVAMFDEVDEGTAIFKCTNDPPTANGASFLTYDGLPSDHYLRLTGLAGKILRNEIQPDSSMPKMLPQP